MEQEQDRNALIYPRLGSSTGTTVTFAAGGLEASLCEDNPEQPVHPLLDRLLRAVQDGQRFVQAAGANPLNPTFTQGLFGPTGTRGGK